MKIISVVGARPNFMKIAPFIRAIDEKNQALDGEKIENVLVHTGQHYDDRMSWAFFKANGGQMGRNKWGSDPDKILIL